MANVHPQIGVKEWWLPSTSVNGEGKSSSGCLAAVGWLGLGQNQGVAKLEVFSMLTGEIFIEWSSKKGMGFENFPVMAMHLGYTALGTWGNSNPENGGNNIFLFHTDFGNQTLMIKSRRSASTDRKTDRQAGRQTD